MFPEYGVSVDGGSATVVGTTIAVDEISISDVDGGFVRRETDSVRPAKTIRHHSDIACTGVKAVNELRKLWFGSEALLITVDWVGEPDRAVGVDNNVVRGIKGA